MKYIDIPNLPIGPVTLAVIDGRINANIEEKLLGYGIKLIKTGKHPKVYEAISYHPDIVITHIGGNSIVYAPGTGDDFLKILSAYGFELIKGETDLKQKYPGNIAYNAARVGNYVFHNIKYIDPVVKRELLKRDVEILHVNQGYSKCSISVLNEKLIITSDLIIARNAEKKGIETLLIEPAENILLSGMSYGFIGGCTGLIDKCTLAISGNLSTMKEAYKIQQFLFRNGIKTASLSKENLIDIGSIIPLMS